jgi:hypothetical protein
MRTVILAALAAGLLASCASGDTGLHQSAATYTENAVDVVDDVIEDPTRAEQVKSTLRKMNKAVESFHLRIQNIREELFTRTANFDSTRAELESVSRRLHAERTRRREQLILLWFEVKKGMTEEEWTAFIDRLQTKSGVSGD